MCGASNAAAEAQQRTQRVQAVLRFAPTTPRACRASAMGGCVGWLRNATQPPAKQGAAEHYPVAAAAGAVTHSSRRGGRAGARRHPAAAALRARLACALLLRPAARRARPGGRAGRAEDELTHRPGGPPCLRVRALGRRRCSGCFWGGLAWRRRVNRRLAGAPLLPCPSLLQHRAAPPCCVNACCAISAISSRERYTSLTAGRHRTCA